MNFLSKFSVAETIFIIKGNSSTLHELLKFTFIDLVLKQVITVKRAPSVSQASVSNIYVDKGIKFYGYQPLKHETILLEGLYYNPNAAMLFRYFIRLAIRKVQSEKQFHEILILKPGYNQLFKYKFLQKLLGSIFLSAEGVIAKNNIQKELLSLNKLYTEYLRTDPSKIKDIISNIAGNICLLPSFNMSILNQFDALTFNEIRKYDFETYWSDSIWDIPIETLFASDWGFDDSSDSSIWDILTDD